MVGALCAAQVASGQPAGAQESRLKALMRRSPAAAVAAAPERRDVYTGPVEIVVADDFEGGASTAIYQFMRDGLPVSAYQSSSAAPSVRCGDIVRLEGVRVGDTMAVGRAEVTRRGAEESMCKPTGPQKVAVILVSFPGGPAPATPPSSLRKLLFDGGSPSANSWYREKSQDRLSLSGDVFGPYTLDRAYSCSETMAMRAAAIRAADRDIDFREFQRYFLVFPPVRDCIFGGMATLGCGEIQSDEGPILASWAWFNDYADPALMLGTYLHEFGHNLGLGHSRLLRFPGDSLEADDFRAVPLEYGDSASVMGKSRDGDLAAAHKLALGWLEPGTDVVSVEENGSFLVTPLGSGSGVRALRIRRRAGANEWLWLEYRPGSPTGNGALIRLETPETGPLTNLLDMTPATLDEARFDLGESSEAQPALPAWTTWTDPHSGLTITLGEERPEGLDVFIRYDEPCAVPELRELTVSDPEQEITVPVAATPGCDWQVKGGRAWLSAWRIDAEARVKVGVISDNLHRSGVISIGRNTVRVTQKGPARDMELLSMSPPGSDMPVNGPVPFLFHLRDENGVEDMQALQLSVAPGPGSAAAPCYFRFSQVRRVIEVSADGAEFHDAESAVEGHSGACAGLMPTILRLDRTDVIFRLFLTYAGAAGEPLAVSVRAEGAAGVVGPWVQAAEVQTTDACRALPAVNYLIYLSRGSTDEALSIVPSSSPCVWNATTDAAWIRLRTSQAGDGGVLRYEIEANPDSTTREGRIIINGAPVRVVQFGSGEIQPHYVTLRPSETVVSGMAGVGSLSFYYGLGDLVPAIPESPWLTVYRVVRAADRREIRFLTEDNPEPTPRVGTILVGGKPFTVLQLGRPAR